MVTEMSGCFWCDLGYPANEGKHFNGIGYVFCDGPKLVRTAGGDGTYKCYSTPECTRLPAALNAGDKAHGSCWKCGGLDIRPVGNGV